MQTRSVMIPWIVSAVLLFWSAGSATAQDSTGSEDKIAAVNGTVITKADFDREMARFGQQYEAMGRMLDDSQVPGMKKDVVENLIAGELLYQKSQADGITVEQSEIDTHIEELKKRFPGETEFEEALKSMNLTEAGIRSDFRRAKVIGRLIDERIFQKITISDEETKQYYDNNQNLFMQPEQVRASHILIKFDPQADKAEKEKAHAKIKEIQDELKKNGDFAALAEKSSQCPSAARGGDLGFFPRGQMVAPFEEAVFALKPGELSDIVETRFGYHLIKVTERNPEGLIEYEKIKDRLGQHLKQSRLADELKKYVEKLEKEAKIERLPLD